jgi:hypothetical protein
MGACQGLLQFFTCALFFNANHSDPRLQQAKASKSKQKQAKASKSKQQPKNACSQACASGKTSQVQK